MPIAAEVLAQGHLEGAEPDGHETGYQRSGTVRAAALQADNGADGTNQDQDLRERQRMPRRAGTLAEGGVGVEGREPLGARADRRAPDGVAESGAARSSA